MYLISFGISRFTFFLSIFIFTTKIAVFILIFCLPKNNLIKYPQSLYITTLQLYPRFLKYGKNIPYLPVGCIKFSKKIL
ncbi:hypothetical protein EZS27_014124 [termite gut metagenome]|uniref:Uncharacterized protein n=1 Tax=termite gut metagenome TaxID=433724 RepID=A0A5J4RXK0_9ZZZZ